MKDEKKVFIIKEGQEDWRVWHRVNDWIYNLMTEKRRARYTPRRLRKQLKVTVELTDKIHKSK